MRKKTVSEALLTLLLAGMFASISNVQSVRADWEWTKTVYIRADGSVYPDTAPISTVDNVTYTLTDNIVADVPPLPIQSAVVVERDNIILDGAGYTLHGTGSGYGMDLTGRSNVTITNIEIKSFYAGLRLYESAYNSISGNNITHNNFYGIDFWSSATHNVISGNNITHNGDGINLSNSASNNTISGNSITASKWSGISLGSRNNSISGNNITANGHNGIHLSSGNNSISGNNITHNRKDGIHCLGSGNNVISGNNITHNWDAGIHLYSSASNNVISGNNVTCNGSGIRLESFVDIDRFVNNNVISGNNVTANNYYGIHLYGSLDNSISGNSITANNGSGIRLYSSANNVISGNNITHNERGIDLDDFAHNNVISGNNVTCNESGIYLVYSPNNIIYHNNFVNNSDQVYNDHSVNVWDDGHPSGGNYWSAYTGEDADSDGIGDTPYVIDEDNRDNYPLMSQWTPKWSPEIPAAVPLWMQWWFWAIVIAGIAVSVGAVYFLKQRKPPTPTAPPFPSEDADTPAQKI